MRDIRDKKFVYLYGFNDVDIVTLKNTLKEFFGEPVIILSHVKEGNISKDFFQREEVKKILENINTLEGHNIFVIPKLEVLGKDPSKALEVILKLKKEFRVSVYSLGEPWIYRISNFEDFDELVDWILTNTLMKRRQRQMEAWSRGKRRGRPPAIDEKDVKKYVLKYRELALRNKKALWLILKGEGYKISYRRFLDKVNRVLDDLGWNK